MMRQVPVDLSSDNFDSDSVVDREYEEQTVSMRAVSSPKLETPGLSSLYSMTATCSSPAALGCPLDSNVSMGFPSAKFRQDMTV